MEQTDRIASDSPVAVPYGWNEAGEAVVVYVGGISGFRNGARPGRIELTCGVKPGLDWSVELRDDEYWRAEPDFIDLETVDRALPARFKAGCRHSDGGWINDVTVGDLDTPIRRMVAQWINLPLSVGYSRLREENDGSVREWTGRWAVEVEGWSVIIDRRFNLSAAIAAAEDQSCSVLSHVMEIRRTNNEEFAATDGRDLLECLRVSLSFGFGRKVTPVLPVGYDADGKIVWERWFSPLVDSAMKNGTGWLYAGSRDDCADLVSCAVKAFSNPSLKGTTRFQMVLATQAVSTGFVEQRILAAAPALESLSWSKLVLGGLMTKRQYQDRYAEDRLRYMLNCAAVPTSVDEVALPALAQYAADRGVDGPTALTRIRNHLVHPEILDDDLYAHDGLITQAWKLSLHYVTLLVLHSIGYQCSFQAQLHPGGWVGDTDVVPWAVPAATTGEIVPLPPTKNESRRRRQT